MSDSSAIGYGEAMAELDAILDELERDDLDVDVLATRVQRASELIALCRGRIVRAQSDVDRIVVELEAFAPAVGRVGDDDRDDTDRDDGDGRDDRDRAGEGAGGREPG